MGQRRIGADIQPLQGREAGGGARPQLPREPLTEEEVQLVRDMVIHQDSQAIVLNKMRQTIANRLQQRAGAAFPVRAGDGGEEHALHAVPVAQLAEHAARQDLRAAGLEVGVVVAEVKDAHRAAPHAASAPAGAGKRAISASMAGAQRAWCRWR